MKSTITTKIIRLIFISLLSNIFILHSQIPFNHVIIDANGPDGPRGKGIGDLNADGYSDLIAGGYDGGGLVWYEYPDWSKHAISDDAITTDIETGDIDKDGKTDVVAISRKTLQWYRNPDWQRSFIATETLLHDIELADFNNDGKIDIVARGQEYWTNAGDILHFYIQGNSPTEWNYTPIPCPNGEGLLVRDINNDNKPDVIIGGIWYENTGNIDSWKAHTFSTTWNFHHTFVAMGDIDGDGRDDIILSPTEKEGIYHKIAWYHAPSNPTEIWPEHIIADNVEAVHHYIGAADLNNDGKTDIATAEMEQGTDPDQVTIFINQDNGSNWQKQVLYEHGSHNMRIVDIGNNGTWDLYGANWINSTQIDLWVNQTDNPPASSVIENIETDIILFTEGDAPVQVTGSINITDSDNTYLAGATIEITSNYIASEDKLQFTNTSSITASFDSNTGILTLSGNASLSDYQQALRNVYYQNTNQDNPSSLQRTISFTVNDGMANSNTVSRQVTIVGINDTPVIDNIESSSAVYEQAGQPVNITETIKVSDPDNTELSGAILKFTKNYVLGEDTLILNDNSVISGIFNPSSGSLNLTGNASVQAYQDAIRSITYQNLNIISPNEMMRSVSISITDGMDSSNVVIRNIEIVGIDGAPVLNNIEAQSATFIEGDGEIQLTNSISVKDQDNDSLYSANISISDKYIKHEDTLIYKGTQNLKFTFDSSSGILELSGKNSKSNYESALRSVYYRNLNYDNPTVLEKTISFQVNDGILNSNKATRKLNIESINNKPVLTSSQTTSLLFRENDSPKRIIPDITVTDADNNYLAGARISISKNFISPQDLLFYNGSTDITSSFDPGTGILELSGKATISEYQNALRNITYQNYSDNPGSQTRTISFYVSDGKDSSGILTRKVEVIPVNDAPNLTSLENNDLKFILGDTPAKITNTIKVSDIDNTNLQKAKINISYNYKPGVDFLNISSQSNDISSSFDTSTGILSLTGNISVENWQEVLRHVTYQNTGTNNLQNIRKITFMVNDGTTNSNILERTVSFVSDNAPPEITNIEQFPVRYMINSAPVNITSTFKIADSDDTNLQSATIKIAENYKIGEDQLIADEPDSLTIYFNSVIGSLIITGDAPIEVYQTAIHSVTFSSTNTDYNSGSRRLDFSVSDGKASSNILSRRIEIVSNQTPPEIQNIETTSLSYTEKNTALNLTNSLIINQTSNQTVSKAEIKFMKGFSASEDKLIFDNQNNISGSFNEQTGVLILSGESTADNYQQAVRSVKYQNSSGTNTSDEEKIVTFTAWNGDLQSNTSGRKITFTKNNAKPILGEIEGVQLLYENGGVSVPVTNTISIIDLDDDYMTGATVEISSNYNQGEDYLEFENTETISGNYEYSSGKMKLSGIDTKTNYQEALRNIRYRNSKGISSYSPGIRVISFTLNDGQGISNILSRKVAVSIVTGSDKNLRLPNNPLLYPNPSTGNFTIYLELSYKQSVGIKILNLSGKIAYLNPVKTYESGKNTIHFNLNDLPTGIYFVQIKTGSQQFVKKLIINK